jgi:hypothetical protein
VYTDLNVKLYMNGALRALHTTVWVQYGST